MNDAKNLKKHLWTALLVGMSLRLLSIYFVWGPQALDDYLDNIYPAWRNTIGIDPGLHDYRSPFYMWILSFWLKFGSVLGVDHGISQIRWIYFLQALVSMLGILGVYLITRRSKNSLVPIISMYLVAMHGLMPFASTRSFMESFVMGPVTFAFALLVLGSGDRNSRKDPDFVSHSSTKIFLGFVILGLSSLLRFQVGLIYVAWLGMFIYEKNWKSFWIGFMFGWCLVAMEAGLDMAYGRKAFDTLRAYIEFNSDQEKSVRMPWYNTWLTFLGFLFFPFALAMGRQWLDSIRRYWRVFVPMIFYVVIHSINPHKEERYMYPVVPLSFLFLADAWTHSLDSKWVRWIFQPVFVTINTLALAGFCFINSQVGFVGPFGDIESRATNVLYLDYDEFPMRQWASEFFMRDHSRWQQSQLPFNVDQAMAAIADSNIHSVALLFSEADGINTAVSAREALSKNLKCDDIISAGSISDKVLYRMNPEFNKRRRATLYFLCEKPT